jgi:hypothetical protein
MAKEAAQHPRPTLTAIVLICFILIFPPTFRKGLLLHELLDFWVQRRGSIQQMIVLPFQVLVEEGQ